MQLQQKNSLYMWEVSNKTIADDLVKSGILSLV